MLFRSIEGEKFILCLDSLKSSFSSQIYEKAYNDIIDSIGKIVYIIYRQMNTDSLLTSIENYYNHIVPFDDHFTIPEFKSMLFLNMHKLSHLIVIA